MPTPLLPMSEGYARIGAYKKGKLMTDFLWTINHKFLPSTIPPVTIALPLNPYTKTSRPRTQWCKACGFCVQGNTSAYLFRKAWDKNHIAYHKAHA